MSETAADLTPPKWMRRPFPLPECSQEVLRRILAAGNIAFIDDEDRIRTGIEQQPGDLLPCTPRDIVVLVAAGLLGGERNRFLTTRRGRHFARCGTEAGFDDTVTDVDRAALVRWAKAEVEFLEQELLEALDGRFARVATTRAEALNILVDENVITRAEAIQDVSDEAHPDGAECEAPAPAVDE